MASPALSQNVPVSVFLASLQEYGAYLSQYQAHAQGLSREIDVLRDRIVELERENKDATDCRDILQRMVDTQREIVASLEADLAQVNAEKRFAPCGCPLSGTSSSSTLSPVLELDSADWNSYPESKLPFATSPTTQQTGHKRQAGVDNEISPKKLHVEDH